MGNLIADPQVSEYTLTSYSPKTSVFLRCQILFVMHKFIHVMLLLCFMSLSHALAQRKSENKKAQQYYENSLKNLQTHRYEAAIDFLNKSIAEDPTFATAYQQLGDIYRSQRLFDQAIPNYREVLRLDADLTPLTDFGLGEALLHTGQYSDAIPYFERYLNTNISEKSKNLVNKYLADCRFALDNTQASPIKLIKLPPSINTQYDEYFPQLTADQHTIIFTRKENNQENFYESHLSNEKDWSEAQKLIGQVNSDNFNEGAHCISPDGKYLFFTGCNRPSGYGSCDIYISKKENGKWSIPTNLGAPINTRGWEAQPAISADGKTLYFVSNRAGGFGGNDIWKSELGEDGKWKVPINLGKNINTPYDESSPYIHADNKTLYFSSNGWPGYGGQDLFMSKTDTTGQWAIPTNLGKPINNHHNQTAVHVNMNGSIGFFSTQDSASRQLDIYEFELSKDIKPAPVAYIAGTVLDAENKQPVVARVSVTDTDNQKVVFEDRSDFQDGMFIATLPIGRNYAVHVQAEGYLFDSRQYDLTDTQLANEKFTTEILLAHIKTGNTIQLNNIYFDTNKSDILPASRSDLRLLLDFLKTNPTVIIEVGGHTDNTGTKELNKTLSEKRAQSVTHYLLQNGIERFRITSKGYGDQLPVADNESEEGKQLNRRTEIKIIDQKKK